MRINFGISTFKDDAGNPTMQEVVNAYAEVNDANEENPYRVVGCAGLALRYTKTGALRGLIEFKGEILAVYGTTLWYGFCSATPVAIGMISGSDRVSMAATRIEAVIAAEGLVYMTEGTTVTPISMPDGRLVSSVTMLDSIIFYAEKDADRIYASRVLDAANITSDAFKTAESKGDPLLKLLTLGLNVWAMGSQSIELFYNSASVPFPLSRHTNATIEFGLRAKETAVTLDNRVFFLSTNGRVYMGQGMEATPISNRGLETIFESMSESLISSAFAFAYSARGRDFYCLTIPGIVSLEYDVIGKVWHTRSSTLGSVIQPTYRVLDAVRCGSHYCGDAYGNFFHFDIQNYKEGDDTIRRSLVSPPIGTFERRSRLHYWTVNMKTGEQTVPEKLYMDVSDDGGFTFGARRTITLPALGSREQRIKETGWGQYRSRRLRLETDMDAEFIVKSCFIGARTGAV